MSVDPSSAGTVLICGTGWLGDAVMSMPAVQVYRRRHPGRGVAMLVKPGLASLWRMHAAVDEVLTFDPDIRGTFRVAAELRRRTFAGAYVFPNSFRSAFIPYAAGIRPRRGVGGHGRTPLLTDPVAPWAGHEREHQSAEYSNILDVRDQGDLPRPALRIDDELLAACRERFSLASERPYVALMPGAARGGSKRWPEERFAEVGKGLAARGYGILVLGQEAEGSLCQRVADAVADGGVNLAGRTSIPELAGVLSLCEAAVTNDSGGMHVAAAAGTRVIAVFGLTDPAKTGPMGPGHVVISAEGVDPSRDIPRESAVAAERLRSIGAERVLDVFS